MSMMIIGYYIFINIISLILYGVDKKKAKKQAYRIPERTLFFTAFLGGAFGALCGMEFFHHKTRKKYFWAINISALLVHVILLYLVLFKLNLNF